MKKRAAGLTLLEVLVAISLLSLLSVGILMALRVGAGAWGKTHARLTLDRRMATSNAILHAALESIFPAWAEHHSPPAPPNTFLFFQGQRESMRFVTSYSLQNGPRGGLRLIELQIVDGERGRRVLLNEKAYAGPRATGRLIASLGEDPGTGQMRLTFAPILPQPTSFVIADELTSCEFSYLRQDFPTDPAEWLTAWPRISQLPRAISIRLAAGEDASRLLPVTVTVPVRATMTSP